eukprot:Sspe_Gene.96911::Locus_70451_Transcript_1_1_Confidence_1.000_Length_1366::g.96911::m.96911/K01759/GLO1, gloA; lactoylglutathione lyase
MLAGVYWRASWRAVLKGQSRCKSTEYSMRLPKLKEVEVPSPTFHTVTFRVTNMDKTLKFYEYLGFEVLHFHKCLANGFTLVFMGPRINLPIIPPRTRLQAPRERAYSEEESFKIRLQSAAQMGITRWSPQPGSMDAHDYLYHYHGTCLELIELHEAVRDYKFKISTGNDPPHLGFGGIGIQVDKLQEVCTGLHQRGVKLLAEPTKDDPSVLVLDPSGYAVRIIERLDNSLYWTKKADTLAPTGLSTCRLRVKDPQASVLFYQKYFKMILVCKRRDEGLRLTRYYLVCFHQLSGDLGSSMPPMGDPEGDDAWYLLHSIRTTFLELQHHDGTEERKDFTYHSGNVNPVGFAHLGFMVPEVEPLLKEMVSEGVFIIKNIGEGVFPQSALVSDPDGYWIEVYKTGMRDTVIL